MLTVFAAQASLIISQRACCSTSSRSTTSSSADRLEELRFGEIVGTCRPMQEVFRKVEKVASTDISVLITGETGTGKELIAREIHRRSPRARPPLRHHQLRRHPGEPARERAVRPREGRVHRRGGQQGGQVPGGRRRHAVPRRDRRDAAQPAGEDPARASRRRSWSRSATRARRRSTSASWPPPTASWRRRSATARFREDLYYRLNVVNLHLPPLRDRGDDILVIARYLLSRYAQGVRHHGEGLLAQRGGRHPQVRLAGQHPRAGEPDQEGDRAGRGQPASGPRTSGLSGDALPSILSLAEAKEKFQRDYINEVLALNNGNRTKTARDLGVDPRTIFRHLEKEEQN